MDIIKMLFAFVVICFLITGFEGYVLWEIKEVPIIIYKVSLLLGVLIFTLISALGWFYVRDKYLPAVIIFSIITASIWIGLFIPEKYALLSSFCFIIWILLAIASIKEIKDII